MIQFLDAWGHTMEEKVLHITVLQAQRLMAAGFVCPEPFVTMKVNGKVVRRQRNL
jgi:hypothetical protein